MELKDIEEQLVFLKEQQLRKEKMSSVFAPTTQKMAAVRPEVDQSQLLRCLNA